MWLCPSILRPKNLARLAEAWQETAPTTPLHVRLWNDDPTLEDYLAIDWPEHWIVTKGPQLPVPQLCNEAYGLNSTEPFYGFIGDDVVPLTPKWADILTAAAGSGKIAWPDDGLHGAKLCTHPCIGGDLVRAVGWWALPSLDHNFMDTAWYSIGEETGRLIYCEEVKFDHRHPLRNRAHDDAVYRLGRRNYERDERIFTEWLRKRKMCVCEHLQSVLGENSETKSPPDTPVDIRGVA